MGDGFISFLSTIGYVSIAIIVLLVMITVHEFGHFIAGKIFGFGIEEFSIGFGPKLFQKTKMNGEKFSIRLFPFGGYCAFTGEDKDDKSEKAFNNFHPLKRIIVLISGVVFNYIFALLIIILMFSVYGQSALVTYKTNNQNRDNCFIDKDIILEIEDKNIYLSTDLISVLNGKKKDDEVKATVIRDGKKQMINVILQADCDFINIEDVATIFRTLGIQYKYNSNGELESCGLYQTSVKRGFFETIGNSFLYSFKLMGSIFVVLGELITGALGLESVGGTVTTIMTTASGIKIGGFRYLLNITSLIGVNLAMFNILPIPALDGSRVLFTLLEWIRKKPLNRKIESIIHTVGFVVIVLFAVIVDLGHC